MMGRQNRRTEIVMRQLKIDLSAIEMAMEGKYG